MSEIPCACPGTLNYCKHSPRKEKEEKMKCPMCGYDLSWVAEGNEPARWRCLNPMCPRDRKKPNPSPQQIYTVLMNEYEKTHCHTLRTAFDEFMAEYGPLWREPLNDWHIDNIKHKHPDWHKWLVDKGLVKVRMVRREAWVNVYKDKWGRLIIGEENHISESSAQQNINRDEYVLGKYIKTILLHTWEEPEGGK